MVAPKYELLRQDQYDESNSRKNHCNIELTPKRNHAKQNGNVYAKGDATPSSVPHPRVLQLAIGSLATILLYLCLSISLTFYQKNLIKQIEFPLAIVTYHLIAKFLLAAAARALYGWCYGRTRIAIDWRLALKRVAPTGIASGIDIGFSNWGLELVPISLYTMTKSSTIVFILLFAIILGLEKKSWSLVTIVGLIATGLFMFTYKSTQFNAVGFVFVLVASVSSGIRWSFAQFIMQKSKMGLHNPLDMIYHMQPWMIMSLLPFLIGYEGERLYSVLQGLNKATTNQILFVILKINFGALLAFQMEISEFMVLSRTSGLTLSIAGIFKDICQLALAVELNGDQMTLVNVLGLLVCMTGICFHLHHKYLTLAKSNTLLDLQNDIANDNDDGVSDGFLFKDSNVNDNSPVSASGTGAGAYTTSALTMPLLDPTDSEDDSDNELNKQNASEVIFDVLKRRDMQR